VHSIQRPALSAEQDLRATHGGHRPRRWRTAWSVTSARWATIASAAPLLGLFGTVVGMIEIFGVAGTAGGATGGNPAQLAHGISVALYNTAFGLIVAIPSLIFWRYFRGPGRRLHCSTLGAGGRTAGAATSSAPAHMKLSRHAMNFRARATERRRDQPDPVHRRAAGGADFPDAVHHLQPSSPSCSSTLPVADAEAPRERAEEVLVGVSSDGAYAVNQQAAVDGRNVESLRGLTEGVALGPDAVVVISADADATRHQSRGQR